MNASQIFQIKINENKLNTTLETILRTQNQHSNKIEQIKNCMDPSYLKDRITQIIKPLLKQLKDDNKTQTQSAISHQKQFILEELHNVNKKYKLINQKSSQNLQLIRKGIENDIQLIRNQLNYKQSISQKEIHKMIQKQKNMIIQCKKAILQIHKDQIESMKSIITSKKLNKYLKKSELIQSQIPQKWQIIDPNQFSLLLEEIRSQKFKISQKFIDYLQSVNVKGNRENSNLLYAVLSDKVQKLQIQLDSLKIQQQQNNKIRIFRPSIMFKPSTSQIHSQKSTKNIQYLNIPERDQNLTLINNLQSLREELKNIKLQIKEDQIQLNDQISQQINKMKSDLQRYGKYYQNMEQRINYHNQSKKKSVNIDTEQIQERLTMFVKRCIQNQTQINNDKFVRKNIFQQKQGNIHKIINNLQQNVNQKAKKKQTRQAIIFMEQKIRDIIVLLSNIHNITNTQRKQGSIFNYLSYDKQSLQNKPDSLKSGIKNFRPVKSSRVLLQKGKNKRQLRKSNAIF